MKRLLFLAAVCAIVVLTFAPMALAQQGAVEDLDCEDFSSREEVQATLDADPSDPNDLDADGNGLACDELFSIQDQAAPPGAEVAPVTPPVGADSPVFQPTEPDVADQSAPVVEEDGSISLASDVGTDCRSFAFSVEQGYDLGLTQGQIQSVLEQCRSAGFLSSAPASDQYSDDVAGTIPTPQPSTPVLPDTGGLSGLVPMAGALLLGGGLLARRIMK